MPANVFPPRNCDWCGMCRQQAAAGSAAPMRHVATESFSSTQCGLYDLMLTPGYDLELISSLIATSTQLLCCNASSTVKKKDGITAYQLVCTDRKNSYIDLFTQCVGAATRLR